MPTPVPLPEAPTPAPTAVPGPEVRERPPRRQLSSSTKCRSPKKPTRKRRPTSSALRTLPGIVDISELGSTILGGGPHADIQTDLSGGLTERTHSFGADPQSAQLCPATTVDRSTRTTLRHGHVRARQNTRDSAQFEPLPSPPAQRNRDAVSLPAPGACSMRACNCRWRARKKRAGKG